MTENVVTIFQKNKHLLAQVDRIVYYLRAEEYGKALHLLADETEAIRSMTDAIVENRDYFNLVSTESIVEMLSGMLEAKKNRDYVLLADLLELQLSNFICNVQALIVEKEDFCAFDEGVYKENLQLMKQKLTVDESVVAGAKELLEEPLLPEVLLEQGYRVEFTGCGEMTLAVPDMADGSLYLHSNHRTASEAFLLAKKWTQTIGRRYLVYGFGMGYVVRELLQEIPEDAVIEVFESDISILQLACAFSDVGSWLTDARVRLIYDPESRLISERLKQLQQGEVVCIHYPSLCHNCNPAARERMMEFLPWAKLIEQC